jgi:hypothetical protein
MKGDLQIAARRSLKQGGSRKSRRRATYAGALAVPGCVVDAEAVAPRSSGVRSGVVRVLMRGAVCMRLTEHHLLARVFLQVALVVLGRWCLVLKVRRGLELCVSGLGGVHVLGDLRL